MPGFFELLMLLFNWFMFAIMMLLSIRMVIDLSPFVKKTIVGNALWYMLIAFGYALAWVAIFSSWAIWFVGGLWTVILPIITWFVMIFVFFAHGRISSIIRER